MADPATKLDVKREEKGQEAAAQPWHPFGSLRREVDRLFDDFDHRFWTTPFRRSLFDFDPLLGQTGKPAVDIVETDKGYEIAAEMPGLDEKDVEVKIANGGVTIKGSKKEEKEERNKNYHLKERRFGSFVRYFAVPAGVDADKIEATFKKGILTVTMPKRPEAQKPAKTIEVKAA
jgi:HSP20 family protein